MLKIAPLFRRLDDDRGRSTALRQTAVKAMRGILFSWMQQADKVDIACLIIVYIVIAGNHYGCCLF